jgi:aminoacyl tRNA synthase complex-interacting multifunctional protein 1
VPIEEMQNRWVICLANLKPAAMRGIKSHAMVLCATAPDGSKVELLVPTDTSNVKPGDRVYIEGQEGEPEKTLNPKKKYWETVQPDLKTGDDLLAYFGEKPFLIKTASGEPVHCKVATVQGGGIK